MVERLDAERLPHMGWNTVAGRPGQRAVRRGRGRAVLLRALLRRPRTGRRPTDRLITWAEHGGDRFVAAVEEGPLWSTQFHPEKSGDAGARLIANWVATLGYR